MLHRFVEPVSFVRDLYAVLRQKEEDVARVRREIENLLRAIPLLEDDQPTWDELKASLAEQLRSEPPTEETLHQLEVYYPFIKNLRPGNGTDL